MENIVGMLQGNGSFLLEWEGDAHGLEGGLGAHLDSRAHTVVGGASGAHFRAVALFWDGVANDANVASSISSALVDAAAPACVLVAILDRTHRLVHGSEYASVRVGTGDRNLF